jgi:hypothetical protein
VFTNITGQGTFGWTAAAGDLPTILTAGFMLGGDRAFISSDHTETQVVNTTYGTPSATYSTAQFLSVNRAGSVPPVPADLLAGATITVSTGDLNINSPSPTYHNGITYVQSGTGAFRFGFGGIEKGATLENCFIWLNTTSTAPRIANLSTTIITLNNTKVQFGNAVQGFAAGGPVMAINWNNTASAISGTIFPTALFSGGSNDLIAITARGVDFSAITGTLVADGSAAAGSQALFESCRIASGVTRYARGAYTGANDLVEFINCYDGTNFIAESYTVAGTLTTEFSTTLAGGATDNVGAYSHKMVSTANVDEFVNTFNGFWLDINQGSVGVSHTATVEIISSGTLTNDQVALYLEYEGTAGSSVSSFANSFLTTPLTTPTAIPTSAATWNSPPATPVAQKLQVTFTPQTAGRLRGQVRLGAASKTLWYNPQIVVT